jgi:hypothetical protein
MTEQSFVEIGGYSTTVMSNPALLTYVPMTPHFFWLAQVEAFRIGTVDILPN